MRLDERYGRSLAWRVVAPFLLASLVAMILLIQAAAATLHDQNVDAAADRAVTKAKAVELSGLIDPEGGVVEAVTNFAAARDVIRILLVGGSPSRVIAASRFADVGLEISQLQGDNLGLIRLMANFDRRDNGATRFVFEEGNRVSVVVPMQVQFGGTTFGAAQGTALVVELTLERRDDLWSVATGTLRAELSIYFGLLAILAIVFRQQIVKPLKRLDKSIEGGSVSIEAALLATRGDEIGRLAGSLARAETEQDMAKSAVIAGKRRLEAILENAPDAIVTIDSANRISEFNSAAEAIFAVRYHDVHRSQVGYLFDDEELVARSIEAIPVSPTRARAGIELVGIRGDGTQMPLWVTAAEVVIEGEMCTTLMIRDLSEVRDFEQRLAHVARHDVLTGLPNRWSLIDQTQAAFKRQRRSNEILALICLDLDRFKVVNDSLGHAVGDRLLVETANRLLSSANDAYMVARLGGDEFMVLVEAAEDISVAVDLAERIREDIGKAYDVGYEAFVGASIGIAIWDGETLDALSLLKDADTAMYRAKDAGRDCYRIFDPTMQEAVATRQAIETALKHAVDRGELVLHYQPIIDLATGAVTKTEALIRWNRPGVGLVAPAEFVAIAEDSGLINSIGAWVVDEVCRQSAVWHEEGFDIGVSLNVSSRQLGNDDIVAIIAEATSRHGCSPSDLTVEITESLLIAEPDQAREVLTALKSLGVSISIDDFGTGYASLTYLRKFPIDVLKIDQSFVESLGIDIEDTAIVGGIVGLARALHLVLVAEGVQSLEAATALRTLGCDYAQGYWYSKPIDAGALKDFAMQRAN